MQIFRPTYRWPASAAGIIALMIASGVAAQTPSCGTTLTVDTVLDSDMMCPGTAIFMTGGISPNNVTLDCANLYSITTDARAIRINGVSGATVTNCTIETTNDNGADTVRVQSSSAVVITGNDLTTNGNVSRAVRFFDTSNSEISDNRITTVGVASHAIRNDRSPDNLIRDNTISTTGLDARGIELRLGSTGNMISGNDVHTTGRAVSMRPRANANVVTDNTLESDSGYAVVMDSASDNHFTGNTLTSPVGYVRSGNFSIQNGGLSVDGSVVDGRIY